MDLFGLGSTDSRLDEILDRLDRLISDLENLSGRVKRSIEVGDLDVKLLKSYEGLVGKLLSAVELLGRYTGDLRNRNENLNINVDYVSALRLFLEINREILSKSQRKKFLELYEQKSGKKLNVRVLE